MVGVGPDVQAGAADGRMAAAGAAAYEVVVAGPSGTGKTLACLWKCAILADQYPGARILIIRKTRRSMTESVLKEADEARDAIAKLVADVTK